MTNFIAESDNINNLSDEELVCLYRRGDENALEVLINRYRRFVRSRVTKYFLVGADNEDIFQEGMIGFYKAVKDFDENNTASFKTFASLCITRQIITAIKTATRQKNIPLNSYVSLYKQAYGVTDDKTLMDTVSGDVISDPEKIVIDRENYDGFEYKINKALSKLELKVLALYLEGRTYQEISELINKDIKSVDNALQRIKNKVETLLKLSDSD